MTDESFQREFLNTHNVYRAKHSVPPMTLNNDLSASAQKWADHLLQLKTLAHSNTKDGENLYYMSSSEVLSLTGKEAVDSWYSEVKDYNFAQPGFRSNTGHFTQVVWKESAEVGVGMATNGNTVVVVGQYRPAGNISNDGYFERNVLKAVRVATAPDNTINNDQKTEADNGTEKPARNDNEAPPVKKVTCTLL